MLRIAHIVNVTEITESKKRSYLHVAQPVTMKSMIIARRMAANVVDVELVAVSHKDEVVDVSDEFRRAREIDQYAWEFIEPLSNVLPHRPLPRLYDIVASLYDTSDADYFIYTNLDIGLYPDFYLNVQKTIEEGYDAFCINRKNLPKNHGGVLLDESKLELAYLVEGTHHGGIDCFVFRREVVPRLRLGHVYIGFPPVGQVLKTQIEITSQNFNWIKDKSWTFHLGNDEPWGNKDDPYYLENWKQASGLFIPCIHEPVNSAAEIKKPLVSRIISGAKRLKTRFDQWQKAT